MTVCGRWPGRGGGERTQQETLADRAGASWRGRSVVRWMAQTPALPSGRKWNRSQPCQGESGLLSPGPALGKMQSETARRAGESSRQGEEAPPQGLGGHHLLAQTNPRRPAGQVMAHLCPVGRTATSTCAFETSMPTYLGFSSICTSCVSAGPSLHDTGSFGPGNCSGSAGGECGDPRYWTVCRDPGNAGLPRSAPSPKSRYKGIGVQSSSGIASINSRRRTCWRMVMEKRHSYRGRRRRWRGCRNRCRPAW